MGWTDSIHDDLPAPRPDEPPGLRDDIADELNDHLRCALRRELLKDGDEPQAWRRVLARFGQPARIARQLYLSAMKEHIMRDRITIGLMVVMVALVALIGVATWSAMNRQNVTQQAMIAELASLRERIGEPTPNLDWGSLTFELLDEQGKPMVDWPVRLIGNMYGDVNLNRKLKTDANGRLALDPIRTGTAYYLEVEGTNGWRYTADELVLQPGEDRVLSVRQPVLPPLARVEFDPQWPQQWINANLKAQYLLRLEPITTGESEKWSQTAWFLFVKDGKAIAVVHDGEEEPDLSKPIQLRLPAGLYYLQDSRIEWTNPQDRQRAGIAHPVKLDYTGDVEGSTEFGIRSDEVNPILIPAPTFDSLKQVKMMIDSLPAN